MCLDQTIAVRAVYSFILPPKSAKALTIVLTYYQASGLDSPFVQGFELAAGLSQSSAYSASGELLLSQERLTARGLLYPLPEHPPLF